MRTEIHLKCRDINSEELYQLLNLELTSASDVRLEVKRFRAPDTAVLIAIVGALGTGFGALVAGMLRIAAQRRIGKVTITGRTGRKIEIPADTPASSLAEYVRVAKELDTDRIEL